MHGEGEGCREVIEVEGGSGEAGGGRGLSAEEPGVFVVWLGRKRRRRRRRRRRRDRRSPYIRPSLSSSSSSSSSSGSSGCSSSRGGSGGEATTEVFLVGELPDEASFFFAYGTLALPEAVLGREGRRGGREGGREG